MSWLTVEHPGHESRFTANTTHGPEGTWKRYSIYWSDGEHRLFQTHHAELGAEVAEALHGLHGENSIGLVNAGNRRIVIGQRAIMGHAAARRAAEQELTLF